MDVEGQQPGFPLARFVHRELVVLGVLIVLASSVFVTTRRLVTLRRAGEHRDAASLYQRGVDDLSGGRVSAALVRLRRASALERDNERYSLALAQAFETAGDGGAALAVLTALRARHPEDPEINLRLARLARRGGSGQDAVRYYESALYGIWPAEDSDARHVARVEFVQYLLDQLDTARALAELIAMEDRFAKDAAGQAEAGTLFLRAAEPRRALEHFRAALRIDPRASSALAGAAASAFRIGEYARARSYLTSLAPRNGEQEDMLAVATLVITRDPLAPRLSDAERRRRLLMDLDDATRRPGACETTVSDGAPLWPSLHEDALRMQRRLQRAGGRPSLPLIEDGMDLVRRIQEGARDRQCPPPQAIDRALAILVERNVP
jgi:tetratricopeptide (TPR) repeat protein